jgi:hypothetical protein
MQKLLFQKTAGCCSCKVDALRLFNVELPLAPAFPPDSLAALEEKALWLCKGYISTNHKLLHLDHLHKKSKL